MKVVSSVDGHIGGKEWSLKDVDFFSSGEKSAVDCQRESLIVVIIQFSELFEKIWMYSKEITANPMEVGLKRWFDRRSFTTERFLKITEEQLVI